MNEKQLENVKELMKLRDAMIMQHALDEKLWTVDYADDPLQGPRTAWLMARWLDQNFVPKRFRSGRWAIRRTLSETLLTMRMMRYHATNKRTLLKDVYRAWRALGNHKAQRGKTAPPLWYGKAILEKVQTLQSEEPEQA